MNRKTPGLGQHFLRNREILEKIVNVSGIDSSDLIVEIGAGMGDLTALLIDKAKEVIAIELDPKLVKFLNDRFYGIGNLKVVNKDALKFSYEELGSFKVVANIPYYITKPLIFRLISAKNLISMTLTIQKEVAERICAKPRTKSYSALSLLAQYQMDAEIKFLIPPKFFSPPPQVESAVIRMQRRERAPVEVLDEALFFKIIKTAFGQRRKVLSNSLKSIIEDPKEFLQTIEIDPTSRAEELTLQDFARIANQLCKFCKEDANIAKAEGQ